MVTVRDIAAAANVSPMTVSNVINGHQDRVSTHTEKRVRAIMKEMGYVPSAQARALSSNRSNVIALVFQSHSDDDPAGTNPYDAAVIAQVERLTTSAGRYLMIHGSDDVAKTTDKLKSWNVDGAIVLGTVATEVDALQRHSGIPMVFLDNYSSTPGISTVGIDDRKGGYLAGRHLLELGHRDIGFVCPGMQQGGVVEQRYEGFCRALAEYSQGSSQVRVYECDGTFESGVSLAGELAHDAARPTALFATADIIALGLLKGFLSNDLQVPRDVSLVGFDGLDATLYVTPCLTTVGQDVRAKVGIAVATLFSLIDGEHQDEQTRPTLDVVLLERETVGPPCRGAHT